MNRDDMLEQKYQNFVSAANREPLADDEYGRIAARDALTEAYGLNRHPNSKIENRREHAATAAQTGGIFNALGGDSPCQE